MPITRVQCTTWSEDDPTVCYGEVREFAVRPAVGDFVALGGVVHLVLAVLVSPAGRDSELDLQIFTRELDQDEYLEAVNHPDRPSRHQPELEAVTEPAADTPAAPGPSGLKESLPKLSPAEQLQP